MKLSDAEKLIEHCWACDLPISDCRQKLAEYRLEASDDKIKEIYDRQQEEFESWCRENAK